MAAVYRPKKIAYSQDRAERRWESEGGAQEGPHEEIPADGEPAPADDEPASADDDPDGDGDDRAGA